MDTRPYERLSPEAWTRVWAELRWAIDQGTYDRSRGSNENYRSEFLTSPRVMR